MAQRIVITLFVALLGVNGALADTIMEGIAVIKNEVTTLKRCLDGTDCCNETFGAMTFISGNDSLILFEYDYKYPIKFNCKLGPDMVFHCDSLYYLSPLGAYKCKTSACEEIHCGPFHKNRRYKLYGYFITEYHLPDNRDAKCFKVNKFELSGDKEKGFN
jgi:hypothetical protein